MTATELREIRARLGWSQQRLADAAGVARNSIARQERGELGIRESLARLLRLIASGAPFAETAQPADTGRSRGAAKNKQARGLKTTDPKSPSEQRPAKDNFQRVRRSRVHKR